MARAQQFKSTHEGDKKKIDRAGIRKLLGIYQFLKPYRLTFSIGLAALALSSLTLLAFPFLAGKLLDVAQGNPFYGITSINYVALALLGILLLQSVFSFVRVTTFAVVSERGLADVRQALYQKLIWLPQGFFDRHRVGELMSRLTADVATLQDTFTITLAELLRQLLVLTAGVAVILVLTPKLTGFMLLTFPLLIVAALLFGRFIRKMARKTQDQLAQANVIVEETLQSISVVKAFTSEVFEVQRYRGSLLAAVAIALRTSRYRAFFISFSILALFGGIVAVSWYGAYLVQHEGMRVGDLFSFVLYTTFIGGSIAGLSDLYSQLQRSVGASERVLEILDEADESAANTVSGEPTRLRGHVTFDQVHFRYPTRADVEVLQGISFDVMPGEKIALVGPSGAGKSTLSALLMRFYSPTTGIIRVDGRDIHHYSLTHYRSQIGVVPQEVLLFGGTLRENILYGKPTATEAEIEQAARQAYAWDFIQSFPEGLETKVGDRGVKLSGGQRQRIAIARAILKNPAILILDEATSSLDAASEVYVQQALENLMQNRTTLIIAHRLSTIRSVDRILVIQNGTVAESGTPEELAARENGIYRTLHQLQTEALT